MHIASSGLRPLGASIACFRRALLNHSTLYDMHNFRALAAAIRHDPERVNLVLGVLFHFDP